MLNEDYVLHTDASDVGIGAVLYQKADDGDEKVISFASKAFSGAEKNWTERTQWCGLFCLWQKNHDLHRS